MLFASVDEIAALRDAVLASRGRGQRAWVAQAEAHARRDADAFDFDPQGYATLRFGDQCWRAGRFEVATLASLRTRAEARRQEAQTVAALPQPGALRLSVLTGTDPVTDIGALQANAPPGTLFQAASQFNCLEAPGARVVPVADYLYDPTQGPRASVSAFPGTLLRHYRAPRADGSRFVQSDDDQLNLLDALCAPGVARVQSGYLRSNDIASPARFAEALERDFSQIAVGLHHDLDVVLGYDWDGGVASSRRISQVFTSTYAGGGYSTRGALGIHEAVICRQLLRGAYLGTLLGALACNQHRVVLTMIGGGVFANPGSWIWDAILWACDEVCELVTGPLDVIVNARGGMGSDEARILARVQATGGQVCAFAGGHVEMISAGGFPAQRAEVLA